MSLIMLHKKVDLEEIINNRFCMSKELLNYLDYLVKEKVVFHNDVLGVDYVIKEIRWGEDLFENEMCLKVIVDTIEECSSDIIDNIKLKSPLELLPNKPPEKIAGEEW